jgi:hypothetical protein
MAEILYLKRQHNPYVQFTSLHAFLRAMGR